VLPLLLIVNVIHRLPGSPSLLLRTNVGPPHKFAGALPYAQTPGLPLSVDTGARSRLPICGTGGTGVAAVR
jgi:hypothetical protein